MVVLGDLCSQGQIVTLQGIDGSLVCIKYQEAEIVQLSA